MAKKHPTHEIANVMLGEMMSTARDVSRVLAPPSDSSEGEEVARAKFLAIVREGFYREGAPYLVTLRDQMAPIAITTPVGQLRAKTGLDNFNEAVQEALPELYALATLSPDVPPAGPYGGA